MILLCTFWRKVSFFLSHNKYNISKHCLHVLYVYRCWWMESIPEPSPGPMRSPAPSSRGNITLSIYLPAPEHWRQRQIHSLMAKNKLITAQQYRFLVSILWLSFCNAEQKSFHSSALLALKTQLQRMEQK